MNSIKKKRGRPRLPESEKGNFVKVGISIPDYLFEKLNVILTENNNFSKLAIQVLYYWDNTTEQGKLINEFNIISEIGFSSKTKSVYFTNDNFLIFDRINKQLKSYISLNGRPRLKLSDVLIGLMYAVVIGELNVK